MIVIGIVLTLVIAAVTGVTHPTKLVGVEAVQGGEDNTSQVLQPAAGLQVTTLNPQHTVNGIVLQPASGINVTLKED